jgi:hypothetical protein
MLVILLMIAWGFAGWVANICFCGMVAGEKNYTEIKWLILGAIFPVIALIAIAGLPDKNEKSKSSIDPKTSEKQGA